MGFNMFDWFMKKPQKKQASSSNSGKSAFGKTSAPMFKCKFCPAMFNSPDAKEYHEAVSHGNARILSRRLSA